MDKMLDKEFRRVILKIVNEFKENTNKKLNEMIRKTMHNMKEQVNK
jgi:hypothetical protein